MKRLLLVAPSLLVLSSCAPRYDLFLSWTIDGESASSACGSFVKPTIEAHVEQRDTEDGAILDEHFDLACKDGAGSVPAASFAAVKLELLSKGGVYAVTRTQATAPGTSDEYVGNSADNPLELDFRVTRGRLTAHLTVVGESCGDAGVDAFTVTLAENTSPLGEDLIVEDEIVTCEDGEAVFTYAPVNVGSTYKIRATAVLDLETSGTGQAVAVEGAVTDVVVDLTPQ